MKLERSMETATRLVIVATTLSYILHRTDIDDTPIVEWDNYASKCTLDAWKIAEEIEMPKLTKIQAWTRNALVIHTQAQNPQTA